MKREQRDESARLIKIAPPPLGLPAPPPTLLALRVRARVLPTAHAGIGLEP
jgi:hypothetical protein